MRGGAPLLAPGTIRAALWDSLNPRGPSWFRGTRRFLLPGLDQRMETKSLPRPLLSRLQAAANPTPSIPAS
jgi:hypothetical protein